MDSKPSKGGLAEAPDDRKEAGSTSTRGSVDGPGAVELLFSGVDFFTPATNPSQGVKPLEHKDDEPDENSTESEASEGNQTSAGSNPSESEESVQDILDSLAGNPGPRTQRLANVRARMELEAEQQRELKIQLGRTIARQDNMDRNQEQMGRNLRKHHDDVGRARPAATTVSSSVQNPLHRPPKVSEDSTEEESISPCQPRRAS
jgi:hypothetical protein